MGNMDCICNNMGHKVFHNNKEGTYNNHNSCNTFWGNMGMGKVSDSTFDSPV